jgi:predicted metal-binding protein
MTHTIQVCIRCNFTKTEEEKNGERGGAQLYRNLLKKFEKWPLKEQFTVEATGCMGACANACAVAFQAPGKIGWVFGGLNPRFSVPSLLEFAEKYLADPDGKVPYDDRPPELAAGLVARLHPVGKTPGTDSGCS